MFVPFPCHIECSPLLQTDQTNLMVTSSRVNERCEINHDVWIKLLSQQQKSVNEQEFPMKVHKQEFSNGLDFNWSERAVIFNCLSQALRWCAAERGMSPSPDPQQVSSSPSLLPPSLTKVDHIQVLVAGSLHLVGAVMNVLGCTVEEL